MSIRQLGLKDVARLAELEQLVFPEDDPWSDEEFAQEMAQPHTIYMGIGEPVFAYAGVALLGSSPHIECEIHTFAVHPSKQRQGFGRVLMDEVVGIADANDAPIFLEVRTDNVPAVRLYESYGFVRTGLRKNYYQPSGADAFTMCRARKSERP